MQHPELFISVNLESDGPIPGPYSILSTGAVVVDGIFKTGFCTELKPISDQFDPEALAVSGLDRNKLIREGTDPRSSSTAGSACNAPLHRPSRSSWASPPRSTGCSTIGTS